MTTIQMGIFNLEPLTEDQKSAVYNYFKSGDLGGFSESQIFFMYGRMRAHGVRIDKAEQVIDESKKKKQESYKWIKENEIRDHLKEYKQETGGENGTYSFVRLRDWEGGKTLVLGIAKNYDAENDKQRWSHVVEIEERMNPEYFQELMKRYNILVD